MPAPAPQRDTGNVAAWTLVAGLLDVKARLSSLVVERLKEAVAFTSAGQSASLAQQQQRLLEDVRQACGEGRGSASRRGGQLRWLRGAMLARSPNSKTRQGPTHP